MEEKRLRNRQIIVTGPESTGKTQLAFELSEKLECDWIPELSRSFIENLNRSYTYQDVEEIARRQINLFDEIFSTNKKVIFDTGLIITKVWLEVVYNKCPDWIVNYLATQPKVVHLLCDTDLPWIADPVRENGGEMRITLLKKYQTEIERFRFPFYLISGIGKSRTENALKVIHSLNIM